MPPKRTVELRVGGQTYRVVAADNEAQLERLSAIVGRKHEELMPQGRGSLTVQQAMLMTAMAIAEELESERNQARKLVADAEKAKSQVTHVRQVAEKLLARVDQALSGAALTGQGTSAQQTKQATSEDAEALFGPDTTPDAGPAIEAETDADSEDGEMADPETDDSGSPVKLEGLFAISPARKHKSAPTHKASGGAAVERRGAKPGGTPERTRPISTHGIRPTSPFAAPTAPSPVGAPAAKRADGPRSKQGLWLVPNVGRKSTGPFGAASKSARGSSNDDEGDD